MVGMADAEYLLSLFHCLVYFTPRGYSSICLKPVVHNCEYAQLKCLVRAGLGI